MASQAQKVIDNIPGDFFVDSSCINCDACRKIAPQTFSDNGQFSFVKKQPQGKMEKLNAQMALLSCPVNSIGDLSNNNMKDALNNLPKLLAPEIYLNGFNSKKSYGADTYFIKSSKGNWLIDSPRFNPHLVKKFQQMGGIKYIFLTHQDDVADYEQYAQKFHAKVIIHEFDRKSAPSADIIITGFNEQDYGEAKILPVPGHTKGHMILCWKEKYLFTGDHFAYLKSKNRYGSFENYCWYDWDEQKSSLNKMKIFKNVDHIFPGHGQMGTLGPNEFPKIIDQYLATV